MLLCKHTYESLCPILMQSELTYSFIRLECAVPKLWGSRVIGTAKGSSGPMDFAFDGEAVSFYLGKIRSKCTLMALLRHSVLLNDDFCPR